MATRARAHTLGGISVEEEEATYDRRSREEAMKAKAASNDRRGAKALSPTPEGGSLSSTLECLSMSLGNVEDMFNDLSEKLAPITRPSDVMADDVGRTREDSASQIRYVLDGFTDRLNILYGSIRDLKYGIDL